MSEGPKFSNLLHGRPRLDIGTRFQAFSAALLLSVVLVLVVVWAWSLFMAWYQADWDDSPIPTMIVVD